jgi:hypothetical protein
MRVASQDMPRGAKTEQFLPTMGTDYAPTLIRVWCDTHAGRRKPCRTGWGEGPGACAALRDGCYAWTWLNLHSGLVTEPQRARTRWGSLLGGDGRNRIGRKSRPHPTRLGLSGGIFRGWCLRANIPRAGHGFPSQAAGDPIRGRLQPQLFLHHLDENWPVSPRRSGDQLPAQRSPTSRVCRVWRLARPPSPNRSSSVDFGPSRFQSSCHAGRADKAVSRTSPLRSPAIDPSGYGWSSSGT